ncbi:MAG TPA: DUF969 domain-containing protein [Rhizomicrobium sp.]|jgi:uncharacterized membrane protein
MWTLLGIAVVVAGFAFRFNPLLVIAVAAGVTGWAGHMAPLDILKAFGKAFNDNRFVSVIFLALPAIGLMERAGLQERARLLIAKLRGATVARLLLVYFVYRQVTAAVGLVSAGGQAQMVRPLVAPMAESAAEAEQDAPLADDVRYRIRAMAAATENVAIFFAEDIFIALAPVLLIQSVLQNAGVIAQPLSISRWAIPTALLALVIHGLRLWLFGRSLRKTKP